MNEPKIEIICAICGKPIKPTSNWHRHFAGFMHHSCARDQYDDSYMDRRHDELEQERQNDQ